MTRRPPLVQPTGFGGACDGGDQRLGVVQLILRVEAPRFVPFPASHAWSIAPPPHARNRFVGHTGREGLRPAFLQQLKRCEAQHQLQQGCEVCRRVLRLRELNITSMRHPLLAGSEARGK